MDIEDYPMEDSYQPPGHVASYADGWTYPSVNDNCLPPTTYAGYTVAEYADGWTYNPTTFWARTMTAGSTEGPTYSASLIPLESTYVAQPQVSLSTQWVNSAPNISPPFNITPPSSIPISYNILPPSTTPPSDLPPPPPNQPPIPERSPSPPPTYSAPYPFESQAAPAITTPLPAYSIPTQPLVVPEVSPPPPLAPAPNALQLFTDEPLISETRVETETANAKGNDSLNEDLVFHKPSDPPSQLPLPLPTTEYASTRRLLRNVSLPDVRRARYAGCKQDAAAREAYLDSIRTVDPRPRPRHKGPGVTPPSNPPGLGDPAATPTLESKTLYHHPTPMRVRREVRFNLKDVLSPIMTPKARRRNEYVFLFLFFSRGADTTF